MGSSLVFLVKGVVWTKPLVRAEIDEVDRDHAPRTQCASARLTGEPLQAAHQSHPLRQTARYSLSLRLETLECLIISAGQVTLSGSFPDRQLHLWREKGVNQARVSTGDFGGPGSRG
jgi:hypothetical protein